MSDPKRCEVTVKVRMDFGAMAYEQEVPVVVKYDGADFNLQYRMTRKVSELEFFDNQDNCNAHDQAREVVQSRFDDFLRLGKQVDFVDTSTNEVVGEDSLQPYTFSMNVIGINYKVDHDCEEYAQEGYLEQPSDYEPAGYLECGYHGCGEQLHSGLDEYAYENWRDKVLEKSAERKSKEGVGHNCELFAEVHPFDLDGSPLSEDSNSMGDYYRCTECGKILEVN